MPRHRPVFPAHGHRIAIVITSPSVPPRAQRPHQKTRREPRHLSPFSHVHLRAIGVLATGPESSPPPRSSSPANRLGTVAYEHWYVLSMFPETQHHHQLVLSCTTALLPSLSDLQPPRLPSPPSIRSTPARADGSVGCGQAPASRQAKPPLVSSPVLRFRAAPPSRASPV